MSAAIASDQPQVFLDRGELHYVGLMSRDAVKKLDAIYQAAVPKPTVLSIRSGGGDIVPGMALGDWVSANQLDVRVLEYCLSSCANYVFPAARNKVVSSFAMIGYHGGVASDSFIMDPETLARQSAMSPEDRDAEVEAFKQFVAQQAAAEAAFFKRIGVRADITRLGQTAYYAKRFEADTKMVGWTYSAADFAKLGVKNITVINGPWKPRILSGKMTFYPVPVR